MLRKITRTEFASKSVFINYYDKKFRDKSLDLKQKFYKFTEDGRFKKHFDRIWNFFSNYPEIQPATFIDCVFHGVNDISECLPHRILSKYYINKYIKYIHDHNINASKDHISFMVEFELNNFINKIDKGYDYLSDLDISNVMLPFKISFENFPPTSILSISKSYRNYYDNYKLDNKSLLPNPKDIQYLIPIVKQKESYIIRLMEKYPNEFNI